MIPRQGAQKNRMAIRGVSMVWPKFTEVLKVVFGQMQELKCRVGEQMMVRDKTSDGLACLVDVAKRAELHVGFGKAEPDAISRVGSVLPLSDELIEWYGRADPVACCVPWIVEELTLYPLGELVESQCGYRWLAGDPDRKLLSGWRKEWVVIGDNCGDPIIADTSQKGCPILSDLHGTGKWEPVVIAPSPDAFLHLVSVWISVSALEFRSEVTGEDGFWLPEFVRSLSENLKANGNLDSVCIQNFLGSMR